jgi:uncharacterized membrane protein YhiD involved in acid resistance
MPDFLINALNNDVPARPLDVAIRLLAAFLLGLVVAWIYKQTRRSSEIVTSFPTTLVLLSILIAMVTQVIGDSVARAFSLVGALSIVRFRTVVRDTQDTAYVIFAVVVGMAVGARYPWVALIGIVVVALAAVVMMRRASFQASTQPAYLLNLRVGIGHDLEQLFGPLLDQHLAARELQSIATARQGAALDVAYYARLRQDGSTTDLVTALNRLEGVQSVQLERRTPEQE